MQFGPRARQLLRINLVRDQSSLANSVSKTDRSTKLNGREFTEVSEAVHQTAPEKPTANRKECAKSKQRGTEARISRFLREVYGPFITRPYMKVVNFLLYTAYIAGKNYLRALYIGLPKFCLS